MSGGRGERTVVIGVGSPHGDDAAGLCVAARVGERLDARLRTSVRIVVRDRPGPDLVDDLSGADLAIVVDAMRTGGAPGCIAELAPAALAERASLSTHGFGVAHALRLAEALGRAPRRLRLLGIEVERLDGELSPCVEEAVEETCRRILAWLDGETGCDAAPAELRAMGRAPA